MTGRDFAAPVTPTGHELLDAGDGRRLERFGERVVDRPAPQIAAPRRDSAGWAIADLRFDPGRGWSGPADPAPPWSIDVAGLTMELRATTSGGVGLYPEHVASVPWLEARVEERAAAPGAAAAPQAEHRPAVLNLFAHTGLATLAAARAGAAVTHVDGARPAVAWAKRNAAQSGLDDRPIRWIVDDALAFTRREARRGRRYDGFVLDPPSYGHAGRETWRLLADLPALLSACAAVATPGAFILLTVHTTGAEADRLRPIVDAAFPGQHAIWTWAPLELRAASGARLTLGWSARRSRPRR